MKNIYLIRHGLTNYNIEGKFQGISDISLNDIGQHQAKQLSTYFKDIDIDEIFISNLKEHTKQLNISQMIKVLNLIL